MAATQLIVKEILNSGEAILSLVIMTFPFVQIIYNARPLYFLEGAAKKGRLRHYNNYYEHNHFLTVILQ